MLPGWKRPQGEGFRRVVFWIWICIGCLRLVEAQEEGGSRRLTLGPEDNWFALLHGEGLRPGDLVSLKEGVYTHGRRLVLSHVGTPDSPITIRAEEGARVLFRRPDAQQNSINIEGAQYLELAGFEITGGSAAIRIRDRNGRMARNIILSDLHIHHIGGVAVTCNQPGNTYREMHFRRNHIHHTAGHGEAFYLGANNDKEGKSQAVFHDSIIEENHLHDLRGEKVSQGDGIEIKDGSYGNLVRGNVIHATGYPGIIVYGTDGRAPNVIEGNRIWDTGDHGIQAAGDAIIRNNRISYVRGDGIRSMNHQSAKIGNLKIIGNTILQKEGIGIRIDVPESRNGPVLVRDNRVFAPQPFRIPEEVEGERRDNETGTAPPPRGDAVLHRRISIPDEFLVSRDGHTFGGDLRVGDLNGDGRCDFLVYRCEHGAPKGAHRGGMKPCFLAAFDEEGKVLWKQGAGGNQPSRPMSVAVKDWTGDGADDVICFWHRPREQEQADWQSLVDVVIQLRDGRDGRVLREAAPSAVTERRRKDPVGANWVHQRLLIANLRGTDTARDLVVKLGDTFVALNEEFEVLWTYRSPWVKYSRCPAYIPSVGDIDGDGRDEVNTGYQLIDDDGTLLWEQKLGANMDSVAIAKWDEGKMRAICSGAGHVMDHRGKVILSLGDSEVPHGQEVRVADFRSDLSGPEMVLRHRGHTPDLIVVGSEDGRVVSRLSLNPSPTNVGMVPVLWKGVDSTALLYNGGWLWDLETGEGAPLPGLPPPNGGDVHRMGFHHGIPANVCGDEREELILWDPTAAEVFVYAQRPVDQSLYRGWRSGPRQYNPRIMD